MDVDSGISVMEAAVQNGVDGIEAECGGSCMCATCHCYVEEAYLEQIPEADEMEEEMLDCTADVRKANSRLGCQIQLTEALDGIVITLPECQS